MMNLAAAVEIKVIHRRDNGSGIVEIPLLPEATIDLSRTASGGKGTVNVDGAVLAEIVANFDRFGKPVPIGVGDHGDDRGGAAPGFINSVSVKGGVLYGEVDLIAPLFFEVESGAWRGFSVEIQKNLKTATAEFDGWTLTGGLLTNRPATEVNFQIAATENQDGAEVAASYTIRLNAGKETDMEDKKVSAAEAGNADVVALESKVKTQDEQIVALRSTVDGVNGELNAVQARLEESNKDLKKAGIELADARADLAAMNDSKTALERKLRDSENARKEAQVRLEAEETRTLKAKVIEVVHGAIDRGVSAALFEGVDADPVGWFNARYNNIEALEEFVSALPTVKESATTSGSEQSDATADLSEETHEKFRRMGLDPKYARIGDENELRRRLGN